MTAKARQATLIDTGRRVPPALAALAFFTFDDNIEQDAIEHTLGAAYAAAGRIVAATSSMQREALRDEFASTSDAIPWDRIASDEELLRAFGDATERAFLLGLASMWLLLKDGAR